MTRFSEPLDIPRDHERLGTLDAETLLEHILDTMAGGLFAVDARGSITAWNRGMERITGYTAAEALGHSCSILSGDTCFQGPTAEGPYRCPLFAGQAIQNKRCHIKHKSGTPITTAKHASLMKAEDGTILGGIELLSDIGDLLELQQEVARLRQRVGGCTGLGRMVGSHPAMQALFDMIRLAARSPASVLILGETGTGKELVAQAIHDLSDRADRPFVRVSCAALPESLLESELFGHGRGAFTGATSARKGRFEAADGGTLFLDEIGDVSPEVQKKLLRVLQEREFERVGENSPVHVDIRVIAATNRDLPGLAASQRFRPDLYYRLAAIPIFIPPLRGRRSDIPLLAQRFIERYNTAGPRTIRGLTPAALEHLTAHDWPGNVRELEHAIQYAFAVTGTDVLDTNSLPPTVVSPAAPSHQRDQRLDRESIARALDSVGGHKARAAELLGVSRVTLWKWMKRFGMD